MKKEKDQDQNQNLDTKKKDTDYRIFFLLGIAWFPIGIFLHTWELFIVGMKAPDCCLNI